MSVDSALETSTKTSASRQCLSIHSSMSGLMSMPGLSTNSTSSLNKAHLYGGERKKERKKEKQEKRDDVGFFSVHFISSLNMQKKLIYLL